MADFVYNIAKGTIVEKVNNAETIELLLLGAADADSVLVDLNTLAGGSGVLDNVSTSEANFTNYARKTLTCTVTVQDGTDDVDVDAVDVTYTSAGGALNDTTTDAVIYDDVDTTDANAIPLTQHDCVFTTDGNDVTLQFAADGFFGAS